ncbi:MAG: hypothetical protein GC168_00795 [Candidatus Hydrogenedens sp.]|nr:hypothetical protein [Candidatus Hydrogenedens sp.]
MLKTLNNWRYSACAALIAGGVLLSGAARAEDLGTLADFRLLDQTGFSHQAHRYVDLKALVIMAVPMRDDALEENVAAFRELAARLGAGDVHFFMMAPSPEPGKPGELSGGLPVLLDDAQVIMPTLGLDHAYECVVAETVNWNILYRGNLLSVDGAPGLEQALLGLSDGTMGPTAVAPSGRDLQFAPAPEHVDYEKDIAPILAQRCVTCHSDGNAGPFAMSSHKKVQGWSSMMAETIRNGRMPPWNADPAYGHFANDNSLSVTEKRALLAWLDAGAPKDETEADPLPALQPKAAAEWKLGTPDYIVRLPEPQLVPADGLQDYRYYEVPLPKEAARWLRGAEVRPTAPGVVHHVLAFLSEPGRGVDLEGEYVASYVPGHVPGFFPENTGKPLPEGSSILFQLHYTPNGRETVDESELGLFFYDSPPEHELFLGSAINRDFTVPPQDPDHVVTADFRAKHDILVYTLSPHMHYRGSRMYYEAQYPDGRSEVLLSVPNYDFNWQHTYALKEPKVLPKGTTVRVVGAFDNSVRNPLNPDPTQTLHWGDQSIEEMFIGSMLYRNLDEG